MSNTVPDAPPRRTKPYKDHLFERLQTPEDCGAYLSAALKSDMGEGFFPQATVLVLRDICEAKHLPIDISLRADIAARSGVNPLRTDREAWLISDLAFMTRTKIDASQYIELRDLAVRLLGRARSETPQVPSVAFPSPVGGAEWTQVDVMPLLEYALQLLTVDIPCDCEIGVCAGTCVGGLIWDAIHRARKLIRARSEGEAASLEFVVELHIADLRRCVAAFRESEHADAFKRTANEMEVAANELESALAHSRRAAAPATEVESYKSSITNCYIGTRKDEQWIVKENPLGDGSVFVHLDGYAIVPLEDYENEDNLRNVRQAVREWRAKENK